MPVSVDHVEESGDVHLRGDVKLCLVPGVPHWPHCRASLRPSPSGFVPGTGTAIAPSPVVPRRNPEGNVPTDEQRVEGKRGAAFLPHPPLCAVAGGRSPLFGARAPDSPALSLRVCGGVHSLLFLSVSPRGSRRGLNHPLSGSLKPAAPVPVEPHRASP